MSVETVDPAREQAVQILRGLADEMMWSPREVLRLRLSERGQAVIAVSGPFGAKQLRDLIRLLQVHVDVLLDGVTHDSRPEVRS